jgi:hypothetical protein
MADIEAPSISWFIVYLKGGSNLVPLGYRFHLPLSNTVFIYGLSVIMKALNPHN